MQCDDIEIEVPKLNDLDTALHELGMLSSRTSLRQEYLREIQNRQVLNMLSMNTRYVSNVSIGFRVRPVAPYLRYRPYDLPKERHRTKSESNNDASDPSSVQQSTVDPPNPHTLDTLSQLKKAKSLESIVAEGDSALNLSDGFKLPEVEIVSNSIGKLKVADDSL